MRWPSFAARLAYGVVSRAPASAVGRARTSSRLAPVLEAGFAALGTPLYDTVVPVARGPAAGLRLLAERRSLVWISGRVEGNVQAAVTGHLRPGGVFVDVGASIGFFSMLAARIVGPAGTVVAFEPQPAAAGSIRKNASLNGFENLAVVEIALSSRPGYLWLGDVGKATAHVVTDADKSARSRRVPCSSLDVSLAEMTVAAPDLVKIDVEGHEADVLEGMRATLGAARTVVVVECHSEVERVVGVLGGAGYAVSSLVSSGQASDAGRGGHLLAVPGEVRGETPVPSSGRPV
jgi:FkbM family methyltransferase